jgi:hypothetical protein
MFKRLPAEVTTRRRPTERLHSGPTEAADATVDLEQVIQRKPEGRAKWLAKALAQAEEGRLEAQVLYDIVTAQRFAEDLTDKVGRKMYRALHSHLSVFSSKQRKYLEKDCSLARRYAATAFNGGQKEDDGAPGNSAEAKGNAMEEMMLRVQAFVKKKEPAKDKEKAKDREKDKERDEEKSKGKDRGRGESRDKEKSRRLKASSSSRGSSTSGRRAKRGKSRGRKPTNAKRKARRDSSSKSSSSSGRRDKKKRRR